MAETRLRFFQSDQHLSASKRYEYKYQGFFQAGIDSKNSTVSFPIINDYLIMEVLFSLFLLCHVIHRISTV